MKQIERIAHQKGFDNVEDVIIDMLEKELFEDDKD